MKKFISVILAALMLVTVMPFAIFAADYTRPANEAHVCHPVKDGKPVTTDVDMKALFDAGDIAIAFDNAKDYNKPQYLVDGKTNTATRLTKGDKTVITITAEEAIDFATLKVVVNGSGTINGGSDYADKVTVASNHDFKVKVVVYAKGTDADVKVFEKELATKDLTELVFDVYETGYKVVITTAGTKEEGKGGPRLWEIDATTFQGEDAYVHTWVNTITKYPALGVEGEYTQKCSKCGYDNPEKQVIPALTPETIKGGVLTADDVTFTEILAIVDSQGNPVKDDDGNKLSYAKPTQAKPENLLDGNIAGGSCWTENGNYWTARMGAKLDIKLKEAKVVSYVKVYVTSNAWPKITFKFFDGETLVGSVCGDSADGSGWFTSAVQTNNSKEYDMTAALNIAGKQIDRIEVEITEEKKVNYAYAKIAEIEVGVHEHVYDDSLIETAEGTRVAGKTCQYTFADASKVVCRECGAAAGKATESVTLTLHDYPETVVDGKVVFDQSKASVTAATCGKDGKVEYTCSHKFNDTTKPVYARYFKEVDGKKVPVYGNNNQQLYLGKDGKGYDGTKITDWSTIVVEKYNDTACGDKLVEVIPATGAHKGTTTTVRLGKIPTCGANGTAYLICTDCKQRVDVKTVLDLKGLKLSADLVDLNGKVIVAKNTVIGDDQIDAMGESLWIETGVGFNLDVSLNDEKSGEAYTIRFAVNNDGEVTSIEALAKGYHTLGYKNVVPSTYTVQGTDVAYCTKCGTTFTEMTKAADLAVPNAKVRFIEFSVRTAEFEGVRATFSLNNDVIKNMQAAGYNVRIYAVVTNAAGVSKEVQVYGAGAKATVALDGRFNIVVKGAAADETLTFSYKVVVDDAAGTAENVVELASASLNDVKAAK